MDTNRTGRHESGETERPDRVPDPAPEGAPAPNEGRPARPGPPDDEPPAWGAGWWLFTVLLLAFSVSLKYCAQ